MEQNIITFSPEKALLAVCARNEVRYLPNVVAALQEASPDLHHTEHVVVVDNGSNDRTDQIAKDLGAHVLHNDQRGKGWAMKTLFEYAGCIGIDKVTLVDDDLVAVQGDHLNRLTEPVVEGAPMSIGYLGGRNLIYKAIQGHWGGFSGQRCISKIVFGELGNSDYKNSRVEGACNAICRNLDINHLIARVELENVMHVGNRQKRQDAGDPTVLAYVRAGGHYARTYSSAIRGLLSRSGG